MTDGDQLKQAGESPAKTSAQRQAEFKKRMTNAGYVGRKVWATPDEHDEIQRLLKSLREQ